MRKILDCLDFYLSTIRRPLSFEEFEAPQGNAGISDETDTDESSETLDRILGVRGFVTPAAI